MCIRDSKLIVYGSYDLILPEDRQLFAYTRTLGDQRLLCVVSISIYAPSSSSMMVTGFMICLLYTSRCV